MKFYILTQVIKWSRICKRLTLGSIYMCLCMDVSSDRVFFILWMNGVKFGCMTIYEYEYFKKVTW